MDELIRTRVIREFNGNYDMNSWFVKHVIKLPKKDYVKLVIDARYLNSIIDTSKASSWRLEPLNVLDKIGFNYFYKQCLILSYNQVPLTKDTQMVTNFYRRR